MTDAVRDAVVSVSIAASREAVWEAITSPERIKRFLFGSDVETTWQVGSPITFAGEWQGKHYEDDGERARVTIAQGNNSSEAEVTESEKTWRLVLCNLKELLEG